VQICADASALGAQIDDARIREWLTTHLQPYRVEALNGQNEGLLTGYYEPQLRASRTRRDPFTTPIYQPPLDLNQRKPWWTRAQIDTEPAAQAALAGREIAYVAQPLDAVFLQIQGSGRLQLQNETGQVTETIRVVHAGTNEQPFKPMSAWLISQGALSRDQASADALREWAATHPSRVKELINSNPRVAFFEERPLLDPTIGPPGTQGVALTPGRSIAVDPSAIPMGTLVWIDSTDPQKWQPTPPPPRPLQRLMVAQDTGSAVKGAVRGDFFWGWSEGADLLAGRTKQPLKLWVLWPKSAPSPSPSSEALPATAPRPSLPSAASAPVPWPN
jgi:membrane-bound lytic murein transglycosylase A